MHDSRAGRRGALVAGLTRAAGLAVAASCAASRAPEAQPVRLERVEPHMGTTFRVVAYVDDPAAGEAALDAAFARVAALDGALSDYDPTSEARRLAAAPAGTAVAVSEELARALATSLALARATGGAFDPTVGPLVEPWRRALRRGEAPDGAALAAARARVGHELVALDAEARTVALARGGMRLDFGAVGKGLALDAALAALAEEGIERALVEGGGDVAAGAPPPGRRGWRVALEGIPGEPLAGGALELARAAVATSGDAVRWALVDGRRLSHVVDPRTGRAVPGPVAATVVARTGTEADALATAACVLAPEDALALLARRGAEGRVVAPGPDGALGARATPGWAALLLPWGPHEARPPRPGAHAP